MKALYGSHCVPVYSAMCSVTLLSILKRTGTLYTGTFIRLILIGFPRVFYCSLLYCRITCTLVCIYSIESKNKKKDIHRWTSEVPLILYTQLENSLFLISTVGRVKYSCFQFNRFLYTNYNNCNINNENRNENFPFTWRHSVQLLETSRAVSSRFI